MKKANVFQNGAEYKNMIIIENIEDLFDYFGTECESKHRETLEKYLTHEEKFDIKDENNRLLYYADYIQNKTGLGGIHTIADFHSKAKVTQLELINQGYRLMINQSGGYCFINDNADIDFICSKLTEKDIRLLQFRNGNHWYAKIGYIDVVIDGEQKWNTKWMAMKKAKEFLETM